MEERLITGVYNELGFCVKNNGKSVYAGGNYPFSSKEYVEAKHGMGIEMIKELCAGTVKEIMENPSQLEDVGEAQFAALRDGGIEYDKSLKPNEVALQIEAMK